MFLQEEDYLAQIREEDLSDLTITEDIRQKAEAMAQEEICSYLDQRYDTAIVFFQTGDDRNPLIVMYYIDIALYHLFSNVTPRDVPDIRTIRYEKAIKWLEKVAAGRLNPTLPLLSSGNNGSTNIGTSIFGSNEQNNYNW